MAYKNQQQFIDVLEKEGELLRIKSFVNPKLEIAEITDRMSKQPGGGKALLFGNTGYDFPVLMNAYGSEKRMCLALGVNHLDDVAKEIEELLEDHETVIKALRQNIDDSDKKMGDAGTADFLTGLMQEHETIAWTLRRYLN